MASKRKPKAKLPAPVAVPEDVRRWALDAQDCGGAKNYDGVHDTRVAEWILSLPTAPPAGLMYPDDLRRLFAIGPVAPPAGRSAAPEGELERLLAEHEKLHELHRTEEDEHLSALSALDKARAEVESLRKERDEARAECKEHEDDYTACSRTREKARAECDQLRAALWTVVREAARRDAT